MTAGSDMWQALGTPAPTALTEVRLELHWAVQIIAAVPHTFRQPVPDDSHTNLGWDTAARRFTARPVGTPPVQAALHVPDLTLQVLGPDGAVLAARALNGATLEEGYRWLGEAVGTATNTERKPIQRRDYEMPAHPVGNGGARFRAGGLAGLAELARWYGNAHHVLAAVAAGEAGAGELRTWPHHFDLATLIALDPGEDPETARSINAGFSPGDGFYAEPYFYVTPWPAPPGDRLPALRSDGEWHTEGFTAAVLTGSRTAVGGASDQASRVTRYLSAAVETCRSLLGA